MSSFPPTASRRAVFLLMTTSFLVSGVLCSHRGTTDEARVFGAQEYAQRRAQLYQAMGEDIALIYGIEEPDDYLRARQYNNFHYLTGVETPGSALLLDGRTRQATLFVPQRAMRPGLQEQSGVEQVAPTTAFADSVRAAAQGRQRIYLPRWDGEGRAQARDSVHRGARPLPGDRRPTRAEDFRAAVLELTGPLEVIDLETILDSLRRVKSPAEIAVMRRAARIGAEAIAEAIRATRPGILERELEAVIESTFLRLGAFGGAWTPIVASGPNITELHYMANSRQIQPGDMILIDAGPDYHYYCSDITRAWPASGPYPPRYRELYDKLLAVHKATIAALRPGATMRTLSEAMMAEAKAQGIEHYVFPNPGHYTGMSPHDVGDPQEPFVPGVCFNVEPLLLVREEGLHLRIEDTVLCTESGAEVLTPLDVLPWEAEKLLQIRDEGWER